MKKNNSTDDVNITILQKLKKLFSIYKIKVVSIMSFILFHKFQLSVDCL